jgi:hypothetical protein
MLRRDKCWSRTNTILQMMLLYKCQVEKMSSKTNVDRGQMLQMDKCQFGQILGRTNVRFYVLFDKC